MEGAVEARRPRDLGPKLATLLAFMKQTLADSVEDVRASDRLSESPACLIAPEFGPDRRLEKILAQHGKLGGAAVEAGARDQRGPSAGDGAWPSVTRARATARWSRIRPGCSTTRRASWTANCRPMPQPSRRACGA